ncbi:MAG: DUF255 domain-containing protein [Candidatus Sedimenticola sp. (ex Thyasira tokunagai)]
MLKQLLITLLLLLPSLSPALTNQLKDHPSPYLAMHGDDPVQWQEWGEAALEKAEKENKLLFISSGYFACHWCHVMQRESYRNPQIAAFLNRHFIPVKIDRELQPALDEHLIEFVRRTRGHAGWPLNVFLTPEGYPVFGLTYSPSEQFDELLMKLKVAWGSQSGKLNRMAQQAAREIEGSKSIPDQEKQVDPQGLHVGLVTMALAMGDEMEGGFGKQNRFPMAPQWSVLLERLASEGDEKLQELAELTLDQMANQGLRDHLQGGFFRYTVDTGWQVPHFEKMLYTQALLSHLYIQAAGIFDRPDYLQVAADTLDFTLEVMAGEGGGYIASLSAVDPQGVEGGGYLWSEEQLTRLLSPKELTFARTRWGLEGGSANEGGFLPLNASGLAELEASGNGTQEALHQLQQRVLSRLLNDRQARNHPRDEKQLAAWNGLFLSALVEGAGVLKDERYRQAAKRLRDYLVTQLWDGKRLLRAKSSGGPLGRAALEDYAYVARGLWEWARLTDSQEDLKLSRRLVNDAWDRFYRNGGWQASDALLIPGIATDSVISDGPLPSPAAELIALSLSMGDPELEKRARSALVYGHAEVDAQPLWYATHAQVMINSASR